MSAGRPRKYPPEVILEKAMQVFWAKGYEGTSMADIMAATGMHKGSLYQTFGGKKDLFMAALTMYLDHVFAEQQAVIAAHPDEPAQALRAALNHMLTMRCDHDDQLHGGCMIVNSLVDSAPYDDEISGLLAQKQQKMIGALMQLIAQIHAKDPDQLNGPPEMVGGMIGITMQGLSIEMKNDMDLQQAEFMLNQQLDLLGV